MPEIGFGAFSNPAVQQVKQQFDATLTPEQQAERAQIRGAKKAAFAQIEATMTPDQKALKDQIKTSMRQAKETGSPPPPEVKKMMADLKASFTPEQKQIADASKQQIRVLRDNFENSLSADQKNLENQLKATIAQNAPPGFAPPFKA
jgi:hypothetical protein